MDSSSQLAEDATRGEQEKQVRAWLRKMLNKDVKFRMDEKTFIALRKLMTLQEGAEADARDQIKVLEERSKFFVKKAENLEAGLRAGNIAPEQLPKEARGTLEDLAHAGTLLDCHDVDSESFEKKPEELCQQRKKLQAQQSELQDDVANIEQLTHRMEQHLLDVANKDMHTTAADQECELARWKRHEMKYRSKVTKLEKHPVSSKRMPDLDRIISISKKLHTLELRIKDVENELPTLDLPPDEDAIKIALDYVTDRCEELDKAFGNKIEKKRGK
ncbi:protein Hook homolog 1-like [Dermacentor albipictus]|uniref:protein Hook homolog 1-like n=1 Tax=Dermacentor albipictus TaxID=60249 RepID=UPI0038FCB148